MNILHVIESLDPRFGGPSVSVPNLAAAQAKAGHEVTLFCYKGRATAEELHNRDTSIEGIEKVNIIYHQYFSKIELFTSNSAKKALVPLISSSDIVHIHGVWGRMLLAAAKLARTYKKRYVFTPRGMLDPWSLRQSPLRKKLALFLGLRYELDNAYFIHALNETEKELIGELRLKSKIRVFPNGVSKEAFKFAPSKGEFFSSHPELNNRPFILFMSRLHYKKGLDYLVAAFKIFAQKIGNVDLVIAGPDEGAEVQLRRAVEISGLSNRIHIVGPIYGVEKMAALQDAKCMCLPSRQEGFSMALIEALCFSLPLVVTDGCHFPEVEQCGAGYVVNLDENEIAEALVHVCMREDYANVARQAKNLSENYLWEKIALDVVEGYI